MTGIWINFTVALGLGLLVGLERERSKGQGSARRSAGVRSFAIAALAGAASFHLAGGVLLAAVALGVAAVASLASFNKAGDDPGITTEIALIAVVILGGLAISAPGLAAGLGALSVALLAMKEPIHRFALGVLSAPELNDAIVLAVASLVVWPILPDQFLGPFNALNPHLVWLVVVSVMAIGACGHIATRLLGARAGLPIAGFAAGFVSSTATIAAMGGRAARDPHAAASAVGGAALSTVATFLQMMLLLWVVSLPTLLAALPSLAAGAAAAGLYGAFFTIAAIHSRQEAGGGTGRAFSPRAALIFGATMATALVLSAGLQRAFGESGILLGAAVAGLADPHAASVSVGSMAAANKLTPAEAVMPILAALSANAGSKVAVAAMTGSRAFAIRIVPGIILSLVTAWTAAVIWPIS